VQLSLIRKSHDCVLGMDGYPAPPSGSGRFSTNRLNPPLAGLWHNGSDFRKLQYPVLH